MKIRQGYGHTKSNGFKAMTITHLFLRETILKVRMSKNVTLLQKCKICLENDVARHF